MFRRIALGQDLWGSRSAMDGCRPLARGGCAAVEAHPVFRVLILCARSGLRGYRESVPPIEKARTPRGARALFNQTDRCVSVAGSECSVAAAATAATAVPAAGTATAAVRAARSAAEAARTLFARTCFVDDQGTAFQGLAIHAIDGCLRLSVRAHFHEAEALGTAGLTIHHDLGGRDGTELAERLLQGFVANAVGQIAYVKFVFHWGSPFKEKKPCGASTQRDPSSEGAATRHSINERRLHTATDYRGLIMSLTNHEMQSVVKEIVVLSFPPLEPPTF